jgi:hypothetical protein
MRNIVRAITTYWDSPTMYHIHTLLFYFSVRFSLNFWHIYQFYLYILMRTYRDTGAVVTNVLCKKDSSS